MPDTTTGETPPTPMEISPTPFSQLVEDYVNLDASFDDPGRLSAPEIQPSDYSTEPLDTPAFDGSVFNHYHDLLHFLHDQLSEYFSSVQDPALSQNFFLTFIVGPPDHINARPCLHSHIIGCHVSPSQDCHSVLFVPVGPEGVWNGPLDWAPLFVYLLVTSLFPDLPCLVCTPVHQLRSFAALPALYTLFAPLSSSPCCPCVYFSSSEFVARGDIFLYLPDTSPAAHPDKPPPPFRIIPPNEVIEAFRASRETHQQSCYTWRADLLDSHTIAADQHFPFYCTPYYGYSPPSLHDMHTMILELATFLTSFAFLADGSPIQALETAPPSPGSLLSPLSSIHSDHMSVYPGEGVFFLDNCPDPTSGDPMIVTWLASFTRCPPPVPSFFPDMLTCLSPGDRNTMPGLFANTLQLMEPSPIPLGPCAQLHLTSSLLPPPFFRPTAQLQLSAYPCGGVGSLQYCHHFNPQDDDVSSLTDISWNSHHLPPHFLTDLFGYEDWGDSCDAHLFFPPPITRAPDSELPTLSVWCPEDSADPSPDHSITICNSSDAPFSCSGPSLCLADWHSTLPPGRTVWQCYHTHSPNSTLLTYLFPRLLQCWLAFWSLEKLPFGEAVKNSFNALIAHPSPGIAAWRFPPHSLSLNTIRTLLTTFARQSFCIEGFGYGSGWAALAGIVTHQHIQPISILISLGGLALHPSTFRTLVAYHSGRYLAYLKDHGAYVDEERPRPEDRPAGYTPRSHIPRLRHSLRIVQHLHDRAAPWRLSKLLLSYLYTNGIPVLTLHDGVQAQLQLAANRSPFSTSQLESHFGRYRRKYEYLVPTLKFVSSSTFFTNFLQPLSWEELEAREGSLGSSYHSDLLDLLFAFLSTMDAVPTPHFPASPEAVTAVLVQGCHRPPGVLTGLFHSQIEPHETPHQYYQRIFIFSLRFPALTTLGVPPPDVLAIEEAVQHILLRCSLPQALDFLHTQLLAGICVANPVRDSPTTHPSPPLACYLTFPPRVLQEAAVAPQFRCWITRRISPNMAVISLKCNSSSWACSLAKGNIDGSYHFGFSPGNFLQLAFPCTKEFNNDNNANSIHFAFAIYLLNTSGGKGRISTETPQTKQKDAGATQITLLTGILLPLLLRSTYRSDNPYAREGRVFSQLSLPLFPRTDAQLAEAITLPVLDMEHSFYMPISALPGLFSRLVQVPLYRQPNTLGWAGLDSQLPTFTRSAEETIDFSPLSGLLHFLPHFLPSAVKPLIQHYLFDDQLRYDPACFDYLQSNHFLPGTSSEAMNHTYVWDLSWTISFDAPGIKEALELLSHSHPGLCHLFRALGPHFHRSLIHALVAPNGHFPALLNATLWGLRSGHTSLCVQGIFGSGKTYSSSLLLILVTSVLGLRTVLSADPNLPLATAAENISDLLRDAHQTIRSQYARCLAQNIPQTTDIDVLSVDRSSLFQPDSLLRLLVTQGSILRDATSAHPLFTSFLILCLLAINDEAQQGGQSGFTILAALLSRFCLQIFTGDREQTRTGTGGDFLKEELLKRLSHKNIGFLGKPNPLLPHELTSSLCAALSHCPNYKDICPDLPTSPMQLAAALAAHPVPDVYFPKTVHDAEGLQSYPIPDTKGILMHLILPHSLRCPADAYFTQVVSHYPHLHRESDTGELRYGHFEDPLPSISSLRLPVDMQGQTHHISGYRLLHWSPVITQNAHIDRASLDTVLTVAGVLSFFTARSIRLNDENSKLLLLAPHNDTIQDLQDALGTPSPHFPPTLYDFYLTCIFRVMLLPTHISSFPVKTI